MTLPWSVLRWASKILPASPPGRSGYVQVRRGCELVKKTSLAPFSTLSSPLAVGLIGSSLHNYRRFHSQSLRFFSTMSSEEITHETIKGEFYTQSFYPALPLSHDDRPSHFVSPIVANILKNPIPTIRIWRELHQEFNPRINDTRRPHLDTTAQLHLTPCWRIPQASPHDEPTDRPLHYSHFNPNPNIG